MEQSSSSTPASYTCPDCNGDMFILGDDGRYIRCKCYAKELAMKRIRASGLGGLLEKYTFNSYTALNAWQADIKRQAQAFLDASPGTWLYIGGQTGCGKTHICTAIAGEILGKAIDLRYIMWRRDSLKIKTAIKEPATYEKLLSPILECDVLYIDDFMKAGDVTAGDINLAFDVINSRYVRQDSTTIISSEMTISDVMNVDEAIAGRIIERCAGRYCLGIPPDKAKNYRLKMR